MKTLSLLIVAILLVFSLTPNAVAQGQKTIGAGLDLMFPIGSFADSWGTGFGGTVEFDYALTPKSNITGKIGYIRWGAKDLPSGATASYGAVPVLVGLKYYPQFIPSGPVRVYGHLELGLMIGSVSASGKYTSITASKTDFTIAPSVGIDIPAGTSGRVDLSVRFYDISEKNSIGFRAGYEMSI